MEEYTPTIEKEELAPGLVVYKNVIPGHHQLIPYIEMVSGAGVAAWGKTSVGSSEVDSMVFSYPPELKDPNDASVSFEDRVSLVLAGFIGFVENDYIDSRSLGHKAHSEFTLLKYGTGQSMPYSKIYDDQNKPLIVLYYFNQDFEGGALTFVNKGLSYIPKENQVLMFPADEEFEYAVAEITSGTKYAAVSYISVKDN